MLLRKPISIRRNRGGAGSPRNVAASALEAHRGSSSVTARCRLCGRDRKHAGIPEALLHAADQALCRPGGGRNRTVAWSPAPAAKLRRRVDRQKASALCPSRSSIRRSSWRFLISLLRNAFREVGDRLGGALRPEGDADKIVAPPEPPWPGRDGPLRAMRSEAASLSASWTSSLNLDGGAVVGDVADDAFASSVPCSRLADPRRRHTSPCRARSRAGPALKCATKERETFTPALCPCESTRLAQNAALT